MSSHVEGIFASNVLSLDIDPRTVKTALEMLADSLLSFTPRPGDYEQLDPGKSHTVLHNLFEIIISN